MLAVVVRAFIALIMAFKVGATFDMFVEFDREYREFQIRNNVLFVTKATKTKEVVNSCLTAGLQRLKAELKYANATYACKHGGSVRTTRIGIRPQQRYGWSILLLQCTLEIASLL